MVRIYVGVDVSKYKFDVCVKNDDNEILIKHRTYDQFKDDMDRFIQDIENTKMDNSDKIIIGLESTGIYHRNLMGYLLEQGYNVREFNPIEIYGLRKGRIRNAKTDKIDAEVIANAVKLDAFENTQRYLQNEEHMRMRELGLLYNRLTEKSGKLKTELRSALTVLCPGYDAIFTDVLGKSSKEILRKCVKHTKLFEITEEDIARIMRKNFMNQASIQDKPKVILETFKKSTLPEYYKESLVVDVKFILEQHDLLKKQISMLERRMDRVMREIDPLSKSIHGVGPVTCAIVLGTLGNVKRFKDGRAVTAYAGLDPIVRQSGSSINWTGHISKRGNKYLRKALCNAAVVAIQKNPVIRKKYADLMKRGKPHKVALTACARKLLLIIYSVEKNQKRFYVPSYVTDE